MISSPPLDFQGRVVAIIGGGPSLQGVDPASLSRFDVTIGLNRTAFCMGTDYLFSMDRHFPRRDQEEILAFVGAGKTAILARAINEPEYYQADGLFYIERRRGNRVGVSRDVVHGTHSGFAALDFAISCGALEVHLLGVDMAHRRKQTHFHGGYGPKTATDRLLQNMARGFEVALPEIEARGVRVVNWTRFDEDGSPWSRVKVFPLEDVGELAHGS